MVRTSGRLVDAGACRGVGSRNVPLLPAGRRGRSVGEGEIEPRGGTRRRAVRRSRGAGRRDGAMDECSVAGGGRSRQWAGGAGPPRGTALPRRLLLFAAQRRGSATWWSSRARPRARPRARHGCWHSSRRMCRPGLVRLSAVRRRSVGPLGRPSCLGPWSARRQPVRQQRQGPDWRCGKGRLARLLFGRCVLRLARALKMAS